MIGNKKLSVVRKELQVALAKEGQDPLLMLNQLIADGEAKRDGTEVLKSLKRILERDVKKKRGQTKQASKR